jgi:shikimate kinase
MKQKAEIEDKERTATFKSGITGKRPEKRTGPKNVFLAGLPGSGKVELAKAVADKTGREFVNLAETMADSGLDAVEKAVTDIACGQGAMAAIPAKALASNIVRETVADCGVVVYLMADMPLLLDRYAKDPALAAAEGASSEDEIRSQFMEYEPLVLGMAAAIVRADNAFEDNVDDLADKLKVMAGNVTYDVQIDGVE